jgi:hypothetical protein
MRDPLHIGRLVPTRKRIRLAVALCLWLGAAATTTAETLNPELLPEVTAATFEVVQAKPVHDPLSYEKPLPLDLLSYQQRTDKYHSIGTAFAIGPNRYVTAGHVLLAGIGSPWGPIQLRDSKGHVYTIDKIEKFSLGRDFVVFSLKQPPPVAALPIDTKPALNSVVHAVGNALGTGVVIRDGLYTSDTPEQQDGAWKWMRFSAAASPGNSGGPLLDAEGKVIGMVVAKSPNENLNYALPIGEVLVAPANQAVLDRLTTYQLDILGDARYNNRFKAQFALPERLDDFDRTYETLFDAENEKSLKALLEQESSVPFPHDSGAARMLHSEVLLGGMPSLIARNASNQWVQWQSCCRQFDLGDNGRIDLGALGRTVMMHLYAPDSVSIAKLHGDAGLRMNLVLRTGLLHRPVATQTIKVTSLGQPIESTLHVDDWGRRWHVDTWPLPYADAYATVYSLPVPDGSMMMMRLVPTGHRYDNRLDMSEIANFLYFDYTGSLAQWKQFLQETTLLPVAFKRIHISFDYGHSFSYRSQRVAFSFTPRVQSIDPNSWLEVAFSYFLDKGRVVWDVQDVRVWKSKAKDNSDRINVDRFMAIPEGLDGDMMSKWQKISRRRHPYDGVARDDDDVMKIDAVVDPGIKLADPPTVLYTAFYGIEGEHPQNFMKAKLDLLMKHMQVFEH